MESSIILVVELIGIIAFAVSGAVVAIEDVYKRQRLYIFG